MMLYINRKADFAFKDARGALVQLVHEGYDQVNVLKTNAGVERGGHYHKISRELFYVVSGSVIVSLEKDGCKENKRFNEGDFFEIPPYVIHSMNFDEDCVLVALYDKCVELENGEKDIYPA